MKGFADFIREQGVAGLAVGFILGGAVSKVVASLVSDIVNPIVGVVLGMTKGLADAVLVIGPVEIMWGTFCGGSNRLFSDCNGGLFWGESVGTG